MIRFRGRTLAIMLALLPAGTGCGEPAPDPDRPCTDCEEAPPPPGPCVGVTFTDRDGAETPYTEDFTVGAPVTLRRRGTLRFCPGDWFVRLTVDADVAIEGAHRDTTTLSGGEHGTVLTVHGGTVSVAGLRIDRGRALGEGNAAKGGGVFCDGGARVTISDAILSHNTAFDGGAIYATDGCSVTAADVVFTDNAAGDDGGAIGTYFGGAIQLSRVTVQGSTARDGGAVFVYEGALDIEAAVFSGNTASSHGGAILSYASQLTVADTTFTGHRAEVGGVLLSVGDSLLERVTFTDNTAENGGALFTYSSATTTGTACTFSGNTPDDIGTSEASYWLGELVDFTCDAHGCVWDP